MIAGLFDNGALPVLERLLQFTSHRHSMLTDNIANLSTPYFKSKDLSPRSFQNALGEAIDERRRRPNPTNGPLPLDNTGQIEFRRDGLVVRGEAMNDGILFHDENNRDLERIMQRLAENTMAHTGSIEMIRNQFDMLRTAIRERP